MATPTIPNGEEHFFPIIYEGNGGGQKVGRFVPFTNQATIDNSCLIQPVAQRRLGRTPSSNGSGTTLTFSVWVKRSEFGSTIRDIFIANDYSAYGEALEFNTSNQLNYYCIKSTAGVYDWNYVTNRTFEDTSKWYHIMVARDTTNSTQADRVKIYVDGERITSFATEGQPALNRTGWMNQTNYENTFGNTNSASIVRGVGYLAEMNMIDGQALLPASFGITDTSTGRWIPKTVEPFPTTTTDIAVTVVSSGGNKYALDGVTQDTVTLIEGATYKFDQSDSSNSGHPLRFSTTSNGTHGGGSEYTTGVTTVGTPGSSGAYTQITVAVGAPTLYYYCTNHSGMGGTANTQDQYGTNGFRCKFQDSSSLGDDTSGKGNDLTATGMSTTNQTTDSPTQNHCTWEPFDKANLASFSEGNLKVTGGSASTSGSCRGTLAPKSGKYYFEVKFLGGSYSGHNSLGIRNKNVAINSTTSGSGVTTESYHWRDDGYAINGTLGQMNSGFSSYTTNDYIGVAMDLDAGKVWMSKNGTYEKSGNPVTGANPMFTIPTGQPYSPWWLGYGYTNNNELNCGQRAFNTAAPTGFSALHQGNLPETSKGVSGVVWMKNRDASDNHQWYDSSRGKHIYFQTNSTAAESTATDGLQKFLAGGQQIEDNAEINTAGESIVSWNWVGNGATEVTNTDGSNTTTVQVNTTAGFSILKFTPPSSGFDGITYGHGLTQTPEWILWKRRNSSMRFLCYHKSAYEASNGGYAMELSSTNGNSAFNTEFGSTSVFTAAPNATTFALRNNSVTAGGAEHMAYCWHSVEGFSKFGEYVGNLSSDGPFVYTGFKPAWLMLKNRSSASQWRVFDATRNAFNPANKSFRANATNAEGTDNTYYLLDFLSNGFKIRGAGSTDMNSTSGNYIYMAFAKNPFVGDGTSPVTAR